MDLKFDKTFCRQDDVYVQFRVQYYCIEFGFSDELIVRSQSQVLHVIVRALILF